MFSRRKKGIDGRRAFHFFRSYVNIFFAIFSGIFINILLVCLPLSFIHRSGLLPQFSLFSSIGLLFFLFSRAMFMGRYGQILGNLNHNTFLISRNRLFFWILWTINFHLIFCWLFLIFLGATNGMGFKYSTGEYIFLYGEAEETKLVGLIVLLVHVFVLMLVKVISNYWSRIFAFAHGEFERRRRNLAIVRDRANRGD